MTILSYLTAKGGPVDAARQVATAIGARPYRLFLCWSKWPSGVVGEGRERGEPYRYEVLPRPKVTGYGALSRNPTVIGVVPTGTVRVEEVPLWLPFEALKGRHHPEQPKDAPGPEEGVRFWYEVDVDNRDASFKPQTFRLDGEPERDEENATWILVLARQSVQDRE